MDLDYYHQDFNVQIFSSVAEQLRLTVLRNERILGKYQIEGRQTRAGRAGRGKAFVPKIKNWQNWKN